MCLGNNGTKGKLEGTGILRELFISPRQSSVIVEQIKNSRSQENGNFKLTIQYANGEVNNEEKGFGKADHCSCGTPNSPLSPLSYEIKCAALG